MGNITSDSTKKCSRVGLLHRNYINWNDRYNIIQQVLEDYAKGRVLDIGCGKMPYKDCFKNISEYVGTDIAPSDEENVVVANAMDLPFENNSFDTIVSFEVLEHVPNPFKVFSEISRILKPRGILILTTPQMWHLHEEPNDYYRFTKYGLRFLCEENGLEVVHHRPLGNFGARVGLKISYKLERLVLSSFSVMSFVGKILRLVNNVVFHYIYLKYPTPNDPTGNLVVARKQEST